MTIFLSELVAMFASTTICGIRGGGRDVVESRNTSSSRVSLVVSIVCKLFVVYGVVKSIPDACSLGKMNRSIVCCPGRLFLA